MKNTLKGNIALDGGVLIALALHGEHTSLLREKILNREVEPFTTSLACTELLYILCRRMDWKTAHKKLSLLKNSRMIYTEGTKHIMEEAGKMKCKRSLALPDCFTISLAKAIGGKAIFARREQELLDEMERKPFDVDILFLSQQK